VRLAKQKTVGARGIAPEEWGVKEASEFLDVHPNWLYRHIKEVPAFRLGTEGRWRFRPAVLQAWYERLGKEPDSANQAGAALPPIDMTDIHPKLIQLTQLLTQIRARKRSGK
jgi:hypothetical protein